MGTLDHGADDAKKTVVELAKERYERCREAYAATRALAIEDTKFALGDSDNGWQWATQLRERRIADKRPCLTVNLTAQHCNQIINNIRQNRPQARVLPADDKADKKSAEIMAGLIRNIQTSSNADDAHDTGAEHSVYGGEGYWRIFTEYESETSFEQTIRIKCIQNPLLVYIDCDCTELDKSDAQYGFVFEDITRAQCKADHPGVDPASWVEEPSGWVTKDTIRRAEYFYCERSSDVALLLADGSSVLQSEQPEAEAFALQQRPTTVKRWKWCKLLGAHDEPLDTKHWAGKYLPIVAVVGKEVNVNGEIVRKGIVRDLKDPARMVNYSYSAAIETVALQNKVPYMAAAEAIEGYEEIWGGANNENRAYLPFNAFDEEGRPIPRPERQQPAVMPAAQVQMLQLSTEQMRAASGQQNANFGIKSEAVSGVGIQRLKVQGETATFHFPDNLVRALRYEARLLVDLIPKIYDTRRVVRILGLDGKDEQAILDPELPRPYAELQALEDQVSKIFNPSLGMYDVVIDTGPSYQTQRQEAAANLTELAGNNPQLMQVAGDIIMRSYDFPMADQLAKRLEKTIPPELQDQKGPQQVPPQVQAQMQQMGMQIEQMQQGLQQAGQAVQQAEADAAKADFDSRQAKLAAAEQKLENQLLQARHELDAQLAQGELSVKAFEAETDRIRAMRDSEPQGKEQTQGEAGSKEQAPSTTIVAMPGADTAVQALAATLMQSQASIQQAVESLALASMAPRAITIQRDANGVAQGAVTVPGLANDEGAI